MIKRLSIIFALSGCLFTSCDSFLDIQPIGQVIPTTLADYRGLMTTAYSSNQFQDRLYTEMRTEEMTIINEPLDKSSFSDIEKWNDLNPTSGTATFNWSGYYNAVFYANSVIDKSSKITEGSKEDIDQLVGEAHLYRGYIHFLLVNLYGQPYTKAGALETKAIPLKLNVDLEEVPLRNTVKDIYAAILTDIQAARKLIHQEEWESKYAYRFSALSVDAFEARIRLYMGEWQEAYNAAERVLTKKATLENLNSANAKMPNHFQSVEMITAYESIFPLSGSRNKSCLVSASLLQKYNDNDLRLAKYFAQPDGSGNRISVKGGSSQFNCTFRIAEVYLTAAEAAARLNKLPEARTRLLQLMKNRFTPEGYAQKESAVNAMNQANLITEIVEERARELAFEGHRWFDLRRTTRPRIEKILDGTTYVLEQDDFRYTLRIPKEAIEANPGLAN